MLSSSNVPWIFQVAFWQKQELFPLCYNWRNSKYYDSKKCNITTDLCNVGEINIEPTLFHQTLVYSSLLNRLFWSNYTKLFTKGATGKSSDSESTPRQGNMFLLWGWTSSGTGCAGMLWTLHPQKYAKVQKPSGHGPEQLALGSPAWTRGLDKVTSRGPFQPQPYCDSVTYIFCMHTNMRVYICTCRLYVYEY